jgi:hypothetical protein
MELLTLTMPNPGAKERNEERMKKLVSQALGYIKCSDTYIQCQLYASRDAHTSLGDIVMAIEIARKKEAEGYSPAQTPKKDYCECCGQNY